MVKKTRAWVPFVPYVMIGIGLLVFHNAWVAMFAYHLSMVAILAYAQRGFPRELFRTNHAGVIAISGIVGACAGLSLYLFRGVIGIPADIGRSLEQIGLTAASWPYFIVYFVLANGFIEECYWRSYLGSDSRGLTANDALFAGYHAIVLAGKMNVGWLAAITAILTLAAWFWRQANRWNGSLTASTVSHIAADVSVMLVIFGIATAV